MEEKNIVYTDSPYEGLWTSKTAILPVHYPENVIFTTDEGITWNGKTWMINLRGYVMPGEVIEVVGHSKIKYRVFKNLGAKKWGIRYSIKRLDERPINAVDIGNAKNKTRVNIMGRKSSKEMWDIIYEL